MLQEIAGAWGSTSVAECSPTQQGEPWVPSPALKKRKKKKQSSFTVLVKLNYNTTSFIYTIYPCICLRSLESKSLRFQDLKKQAVPLFCGSQFTDCWVSSFAWMFKSIILYLFSVPIYSNTDSTGVYPLYKVGLNSTISAMFHFLQERVFTLILVFVY